MPTLASGKQTCVQELCPKGRCADLGDHPCARRIKEKHIFGIIIDLNLRPHVIGRRAKDRDADQLPIRGFDIDIRRGAQKVDGPNCCRKFMRFTPGKR